MAVVIELYFNFFVEKFKFNEKHVNLQIGQKMANQAMSKKKSKMYEYSILKMRFGQFTIEFTELFNDDMTLWKLKQILT